MNKLNYDTQKGGRKGTKDLKYQPDEGLKEVAQTKAVNGHLWDNASRQSTEDAVADNGEPQREEVRQENALAHHALLLCLKAVPQPLDGRVELLGLVLRCNTPGGPPIRGVTFGPQSIASQAAYVMDRLGCRERNNGKGSRRSGHGNSHCAVVVSAGISASLVTLQAMQCIKEQDWVASLDRCT